MLKSTQLGWSQKMLRATHPLSQNRWDPRGCHPLGGVAFEAPKQRLSRATQPCIRVYQLFHGSFLHTSRLFRSSIWCGKNRCSIVGFSVVDHNGYTSNNMARFYIYTMSRCILSLECLVFWITMGM